MIIFLDQAKHFCYEHKNLACILINYFVSLASGINLNKLLPYNNISGELTFSQKEESRAFKYFSQFLGIFSAREKKFLVICEDCTHVAQINHMAVYRIDKVGYIPLNADFQKKNKNTLHALENLQHVYWRTYKHIQLLE